MNFPVSSIRRVFRIVNGGTPTSDKGNWDGEVPWATPVDLSKCDGSRISTTQRSITIAGLHSGSNSVPEGSLIISSRAPIGYVAETIGVMSFNQGCKGLIPMREVDIRFFRYQLSTMVEQLQSYGQGSTFSELSADYLATIPIVVPSLSYQCHVANYLDAETTHIDTLISKKRRLIELINSRLICLAENASSGNGGEKETGIPSLSNIPSSWRVLRNKVFMRESSDRTPDGSEEMLSVSHITGVTPRSEKTVYMFEAESTVGYKVVRPGDLIINTMWAWMGAAGIARTEGIVSPAYGVWRDPLSLVRLL